MIFCLLLYQDKSRVWAKLYVDPSGENAIDMAMDTIRQIANKASQAAKDAWDALAASADDIWEAVVEAVDVVLETLDSVDTKEMWKNLEMYSTYGVWTACVVTAAWCGAWSVGSVLTVWWAAVPTALVCSAAATSCTVATAWTLAWQSMQSSSESSSWWDVYAPDTALPRNKNWTSAPDPNAKWPHTQLGTKDWRKWTYKQGREFNWDWQEVKRIDFTDHWHPANHTNPHQHKIKPNPTWWTPSIGDAEPLN